MSISQMDRYFENPYYRFLEEPMLFFRFLNETSNKTRFPVLRKNQLNQLILP